MARIFITGSSTGLGLLAGVQLAERGHSVVLHARDDSRASDALAALPQAETVVVGDLETIAGSVAVATAVNALGRFDAVIHNAGVYSGGQRTTPDGVRALFAVNVLAPYVLTGLVTPPERLVYLSSGIILAPKPTLTTRSGRVAAGPTRRPIRRASCTSCCSHSPWRGSGRA